MSERSNPTATSIPLTQPPEQPAAPTIPLGKAGMNRPYEPFKADRPVESVASADPWAQRIEEDRQALITAQRKPRSKLKDIGEGLATWAASGVGIPLQRILHPRGSETQQAERALGRDVMLQKQSGDIQEQQAGISLRGRQAAKIQSELDNPATEREQGFTLGEGQSRYDPQGNLIASATKPRSPKPPVKQVDEQGNEYLADADSGEPILDAKGNIRYTGRAKPDKPESADTTDTWANLETGFRQNAASALAAAQKAEQDAKTYIASKGEGFDPTKDANVAALASEAQRQRAFALEQTKKADDAAFKKTEASGKRTKGVSTTTKAAKPAKDGKFHYTLDQVRAKAQADGVSYDELLGVLQKNPKVVIQ